jgi:hypothetical protein
MGRQGEERGETGLGGNQAEKTWGDGGVEPFYTVDGYCAPIKAGISCLHSTACLLRFLI